jgi:leucyl aminopeptidase
MADAIRIEFQPFGLPKGGDLVVFAGEDGTLGEAVSERLGREGADLIAAAARAERFKGKPQTVLAIPAPRGLQVDRLIVIGVGGEKDRPKHDWRMLGGFVAGKVSGRTATALLDLPGLEADADAVAEMALGARLRAYKFDRYKTKKKDNDADNGGAATRLTFAVEEPAAARKAAKQIDGLATGVTLARDLVNEPPNVLGPAEFAERAVALGKLGVETEVFDDKALRKLNMRALLGVAQGSTRGARVVIMRWNGGKQNAAPVAFIGKGVVFDSGGISIKPGGGMEDMKGDMAGAACVVGLMHALAARKAKVNAVGIAGLVENMPSGTAQRPGDVVKSMSGQTIEVINTDAEGRLVLADALWYCRDRFKPQAMIDLATLTGAIMVSLGREHAGLFANNDALAERLLAAGKAVGEPLWRMPLGEAYDKIINSDIADMKNVGNRWGGSITAAQFLQRFVKDTPWAHLDIAGMAWAEKDSAVVPKGATAFGVRLLDRFVADNYEER